MARILIIDDEFEVRSTMRFMLEREGHNVIEALDGVEGIQRFLEHPTDLIITDILMPNQDGIETEHLDLAREFGARSVLSKPFKYQDLINAVSQALA